MLSYTLCNGCICTVLKRVVRICIRFKGMKVEGYHTMSSKLAQVIVAGSFFFSLMLKEN